MLSKKGTALSERSESKGFTLVELLVVISIIAILSTIGFVIFTEVQKGARDARRKHDLKTIQTALEIYFQKNSTYPAVLTELLPTYIDVLPKDPKNSDPTDYPWNQDKFSYFYWAEDTTQTDPSCSLAAGQYYILLTKLEKGSDREITRFKPYYYCDSATKITGVNIIPSGAYDLDKLYIVTSQD